MVSNSKVDSELSSIEEEITKYRQEIKSERMDMSFGEIINMYKEGEIIITPEYQRAFRWDEKRQSDFIESILLGIPFPSIFVATNEDGRWELIDGLQRISTVLSFFNELKDEKGKENSKNRLKLTEGSILKNIQGLTIDTLPLEYKLQIKRTPCRVEIILKESDFKMRYELFKRLNTGGEGLSRQEIRNCIYRGLDTRYNDLVYVLSQDIKFRELISISESDKEKMYYEELVLRYLTLKNEGTKYKNPNIQDYMDMYLEKQSMQYNENQIVKDKNIFLKVINFLSEFKDRDIFKLGNKYFTTSMYDSLMLSLSEGDVDLNVIDRIKFEEKVNALKRNPAFTKYVGSASSNPTSITRKVEVAKKELFGII